jgi:hypothetical protein
MLTNDYEGCFMTALVVLRARSQRRAAAYELPAVAELHIQRQPCKHRVQPCRTNRPRARISGRAVRKRYYHNPFTHSYSSVGRTN